MADAAFVYANFFPNFFWDTEILVYSELTKFYFLNFLNNDSLVYFELMVQNTDISVYFEICGRMAQNVLIFRHVIFRHSLHIHVHTRSVHRLRHGWFEDKSRGSRAVRYSKN